MKRVLNLSRTRVKEAFTRIVLDRCGMAENFPAREIRFRNHRKPIAMKPSPLPPEILQHIRMFFDAMELNSFRTSFFHILTAYAGHDYYRAGDPVDVLHVLGRLRALLEALAEWAERVADPVGGSGDDYRRADMFYPGIPAAGAQERPEIALAYFFKREGLPERIRVLDSVQYFALCRQPGIEDGECIDTLKLYHEVVALADICSRLI